MSIRMDQPGVRQSWWKRNGEEVGVGLLVLAGFALLIACLWWFVSTVSAEIRGIEDPTERGLVWIAAAVLVHALLTRPSERKVKVEVAQRGDQQPVR